MIRRVGALVALACLAGCTKSARFAVDRVSVEAFEGGEVVGLKDADVKARLLKQLRAGRFEIVDDQHPAAAGQPLWRLAIGVHVTEPNPEQAAKGVVAAVVSITKKGEPESFEVLRRETAPASSNKVEDIQDASLRALDATLAGVVSEAHALIELNAATDDTLVQRLTSAQASEQSAAVTLLARRHHPAALTPLVGRLKTDSLSEIRHTMGMLVELRDPRAAPALIEASRGRDSVVQREVVFALGAIGGEDAEAYLWSMAQGHDDELVRASAQQALDELTARSHPDGGHK